MDKYEAALKVLLEALEANLKPVAVNEETNEIPVGVSNRHIHLSKEDLNTLFGEGYEMAKLKDLSQPGQYACKETVTICGPNGAIEKVRILGPARSKTQVEILRGDCYKLGVKTQSRLSGDLQGTPGITLIGPKGSVQIKEGLIVAQRHIHMNPEDAKCFGVHDGQIVSLKFDGPRGGILNNVAIRANDASVLECHVDIEEANAMEINSVTKARLIK